MPVTLDDATAALVFRALTRVPPVSGQVILSLMQEQSASIADQKAAVAEQNKLIHQLLTKADIMSDTQKTTDQQFQDELAAFGEDLKKQTTVANGLKVAFAGVAQQLADQIAAAAAKGASADELSGLKALHQGLLANTDTIASAVTEGTVAATEPSAPVVPTTTVDVPAPDASGDASGTADGTASAG
jgi:hypothetical protein